MEEASTGGGGEDFAERLIAALRKTASRMNYEASDESLQIIAEYGDELRKWNKAYNLVGRKLGADGIIELYKDALTPLCIRGLLEGRKEVLDIGSGAGLPGLLLYLVAGPFPLTLVESQRKKITFLRHICQKLGLEEVMLYGGRLEAMAKEEDNLSAYEVGFTRAAMEPMRLLKTARPLLCEGGKLVLFVGKNDAERIRKSAFVQKDKGFELEALRSTQRFAGKENYLAVMKKVGR